MVNTKLIFLGLVVLSASCASNKTTPAQGLSARAPSIAGTLSDSGGALQNAEVKLKSYKHEECVKLAQKQNASKDESEQLKQCSQEISSHSPNLKFTVKI